MQFQRVVDYLDALCNSGEQGWFPSSSAQFSNPTQELIEDQVTGSQLAGERQQVSKHKLISQRNSTKSISTSAMQDMLLRMVCRGLQNEAKAKFWRMVVATTTQVYNTYIDMSKHS